MNHPSPSIPLPIEGREKSQTNRRRKRAATVLLNPPWSANFPGEPGARVGPMTVGGGNGNAEYFRGLFGGQTHKVTELDQLGFLFVSGGQFFQGLRDGENLILVLRQGGSDFRHFNPQLA